MEKNFYKWKQNLCFASGALQKVFLCWNMLKIERPI